MEYIATYYCIDIREKEQVDRQGQAVERDCMKNSYCRIPGSRIDSPVTTTLAKESLETAPSKALLPFRTSHKKRNSKNVSHDNASHKARDTEKTSTTEHASGLWSFRFILSQTTVFRESIIAHPLVGRCEAQEMYVHSMSRLLCSVLCKSRYETDDAKQGKPEILGC